MPRRAAVWPLRVLLRPRALRRRLAFAIWHDYFEDLRMELPLDGGLAVPLDHRDALSACAETFLGLEYGDVLARMPLPARWLDVGAHRGYFSLWLAWQRLHRGEASAGEALLIDGDPRAIRWFDSLLARNPALHGFTFLHAAVAPKGVQDGMVIFVQRPGMGSSVENGSPESDGHRVAAPRLSIRDVFTRLPPPYDLVKVDIEGAELTWLESAGEVLRETRHLVLEWHGRGAEAARAATRVAEAAAVHGFTERHPLRPVRAITVGGDVCLSGTDLYWREIR